MSEVKRCSIGGFEDGMVERADGCWVHIEDYDQLKAENTKLNKALGERNKCVEFVTSERGDKLFAFMSKDPCSYDLCEVTYAAPVRVLIAERDTLRKQLDEATVLMHAVASGVTCDTVHHSKADRHRHDEPCPVVGRFSAWLERNK